MEVLSFSARDEQARRQLRITALLDIRFGTVNTELDTVAAR